MSDETFPVLLMIVAFFLTFLVPVGGVSILGHRRLAPLRAPVRRPAGTMVGDVGFEPTTR